MIYYWVEQHDGDGRWFMYGAHSSIATSFPTVSSALDYAWQILDDKLAKAVRVLRVDSTKGEFGIVKVPGRRGKGGGRKP